MKIGNKTVRMRARGARSEHYSEYRAAHGVFVGVDDVWLPRLNPAPDGSTGIAAAAIGAINDVQALSQALAPALSTSAELVGDDATRANILSRLEDAVQNASPGDLVIAYFSGYTITRYNELFLIPADFKPDSHLATAVSFNLVSAVLQSKNGVRSLLILDACHAAEVGFDISNYHAGSEMGLMVSCGPEELSCSSVDDDDTLHGDFTSDLVGVLEDRQSEADGSWTIWLIDWFDMAYKRTVNRGNGQHPVMLGTLNPNLELRSRRAADMSAQKSRDTIPERRSA